MPGTRLSQRVHVTAADKKKINKISISFPIPRTLKLSTINTRPFILESCIPVQEFRERYPPSLLFDIILGARRFQSHSAPAFHQRNSLGGTTLYSVTRQQRIAAHSNLPPNLSQNLQHGQVANDTASPAIFHPHHNNIEPELLVRVYDWLDHVEVPTATEAESSSLVPRSVNTQTANFNSGFVPREDVWDLIERSTRQRKSHLRQMPNTMLTETNNITVRGSNNTRPSGSFRRPGENHTRMTSNAVEDHPRTSVRRPKSMPSGSQLPACWNEDMDGFICHMDAQCVYSIQAIVKALKQKFSALREVGASRLQSSFHGFY